MEACSEDVIDFLSQQIPKGVWKHDAQDGNGLMPTSKPRLWWVIGKRFVYDWESWALFRWPEHSSSASSTGHAVAQTVGR